MPTNVLVAPIADTDVVAPAGRLYANLLHAAFNLWQIRYTHQLIEDGETTAQVARDFWIARATFYGRACALGLMPSICVSLGCEVWSDKERLVSRVTTPPYIPSADKPAVPELEVDQTIAPRPEEEIADVLRAKPDVGDHSEHRTRTPNF